MPDGHSRNGQSPEASNARPADVTRFRDALKRYKRPTKVCGIWNRRCDRPPAPSGHQIEARHLQATAAGAGGGRDRIRRREGLSLVGIADAGQVLGLLLHILSPRRPLTLPSLGSDHAVLGTGLGRSQCRPLNLLHLGDGPLGVGFRAGVNVHRTGHGIGPTIRATLKAQAHAAPGIGPGRRQMGHLMLADLTITLGHLLDLTQLLLAQATQVFGLGVGPVLSLIRTTWAIHGPRVITRSVSRLGLGQQAIAELRDLRPVSALRRPRRLHLRLGLLSDSRRSADDGRG